MNGYYVGFNVEGKPAMGRMPWHNGKYYEFLEDAQNALAVLLKEYVNNPDNITHAKR